MALLLIEGFDALDELELRRGCRDNFAEISVVEVRTGRASAILKDESTSQKLTMAFGGVSNEVYVGFAIYVTAYPTASGQVLCAFGGTMHDDFSIIMADDGVLSFDLHGTPISPDSGANNLSLTTWYYIEIKVVKTSSTSAGDCVLKVDGVEWIDLGAGKDTIDDSEDTFTDSILFSGSPGRICYIDDVYVCDASGSDNNTFLGPVKVATLLPDGNGNTSDFVGSDADSTDNYLHVDDTTTDDDSTYVESDTPDDIDLYTFDDLGSSMVIHGVELVSVVASDVEGGGFDRQGTPVARIDSTNYFGSNFNVGDTYRCQALLMENNPDDAAAWEVADVDAAEFGIKIIA